MRPLLLLALLFSLLGCSKDSVLPDIDSTELIVTNQPAWLKEPLNEEYIIQFPASYEGNGMVGFEGPTFSKNRSDRRVTFSYFFCGPLMCNSYGPTLLSPNSSILYPPSVTVASRLLDRSVAIRQDDLLQAVFYFTTEGKGLLYLRSKKSGLFMQSLTVDYTYDLHLEVLGILQTIRPRS